MPAGRWVGAESYESGVSGSPRFVAYGRSYKDMRDQVISDPELADQSAQALAQIIQATSCLGTLPGFIGNRVHR